MTAQEIKAAAENYIDEAIDDDEAVTAINAALAKIGDIALIYDTVSITDSVGRTWLALPDTTTYVVEVVDADGNTYEGWRVRDNRIWFADPGTYTVHYRRLPNSITGILATPEVHPAYHQCLVRVAVGMDTKLSRNIQEPDRHGWKDEYWTVFGVEVRLEKTHTIIENVTS